MEKVLAFDINIGNRDFSPNLFSVISSIFSLESREHNNSSKRVIFLDKFLINLCSEKFKRT